MREKKGFCSFALDSARVKYVKILFQFLLEALNVKPFGSVRKAAQGFFIQFLNEVSRVASSHHITSVKGGVEKGVTFLIRSLDSKLIANDTLA